MNSNTICLRIFFVLFILIMGSAVLFLYAVRALTPLAICLLPTETTEAHYTSDRTMMEYRLNSTEQLFHSKISYAGHSGTLVTTSPPTPLVEPGAEAARFPPNFTGIRTGLPSGQAEPSQGPSFRVRFVSAFPEMVVRDLPGASIWRYYGDTWTTGDMTSFIVESFLVVLASYAFYRHLRRSRRGYRR